MSIEDQNTVITAPLISMSIIAGAGSGKTKTAIARVLAIVNRLPRLKRVALLSFSNIAVNTFREGLIKAGGDVARVNVSTFDSFFAQHIVIPYAWNFMACPEKPFLVFGYEPFLNSFTIFHENRHYNISDLKIRYTAAGYQAILGQNQIVPWPVAQTAIANLGRTGAYTYETARYWTHLVLSNWPYLAQLIVTRYPHIIVDEAQDIGALDWAVLQILKDYGLQLSLIGDPAQAIFGFNGADGGHLQRYVATDGIAHYSLSTNFRSVPSIVRCANQLTGRTDVANRAALQTHSGAFIVPYVPENPRLILDRFQQVTNDLGYPLNESAVICRANALVEQLRGGSASRGTGLVKNLVKAVDKRISNEYDRAFSECVGVVVALIEPPNPRFRALLDDSQEPWALEVKAKIWRFVCDHENGLPRSELSARDVWLPRLLINLRALLLNLAGHGMTFVEIGRRITARDLDVDPLVRPRHYVRVDTVHQVKGESIGSVLYIATDRHAQELFGGVGTENGRIGYVALTRARDIFWLAVPENVYERLAERAATVGIMRLPI